MGLNCSKCQSAELEGKFELIPHTKGGNYRNTKQIYNINFTEENNTEHLTTIIYLQRRIKEYIKRKGKINTLHIANNSLEKLPTPFKNIILSTSNNSLSNKSTTYVKNYQINENATYSGEIVNGIQHGKGTQTWQDGAKYSGEWLNGKANGYGTFYHIDGDVYEGFWKDDKPNGQGT